MKVGDRVGAILGKDSNIIRFLGYGTYEGDEVPVDAVGWMADALREYGHTNPKIKLDSGKVVWGCECWWGSEDVVQDQIAKEANKGVLIEEVDIDEVRLEFTNQSGE